MTAAALSGKVIRPNISVSVTSGRGSASILPNCSLGRLGMTSRPGPTGRERVEFCILLATKFLLFKGEKNKDYLRWTGKVKKVLKSLIISFWVFLLGDFDILGIISPTPL